MIRFKLRYSIQDLAIKDKEVSLELKLNHDIKIKLSIPDNKYLEQSGSPFTVFCDAELVIEPSPKNLLQFERIIDNKVVTKVANMTSYRVMQNERNEEIIIPQLSVFPEHFQHFIKQINEELDESIRRTIVTIRWVCDNRGRHNPFSGLGFEWTRDDKNWYTVPPSGHISFESYSHDVRISKRQESTILNLLKEGNNEPIYHSLFREAWEQKLQNPRSSLIMAISSVEVSLKYLIERVAPDAAWLINNLQSPPIEKLFRDYLPKLPLDNKINGITIRLTDDMLLNLKKWVGIRNQLTHLGTKSLYGDDLKEALLTVKDILHIVDFYSGHKWSINYVRTTTLEKIGLK